MRHKAYTTLELVIALSIVTLIIGISFSIIQGIFTQRMMLQSTIESTLSNLKIINTVETITNGCLSVDVSADEIRATSSRGTVTVKTSDYPKVKNLKFEQAGENVIVIIGGERFCIQVIKEVP